MGREPSTRQVFKALSNLASKQVESMAGSGICYSWVLDLIQPMSDQKLKHIP